MAKEERTSSRVHNWEWNGHGHSWTPNRSKQQGAETLNERIGREIEGKEISQMIGKV